MPTPTLRTDPRAFTSCRPGFRRSHEVVGKCVAANDATEPSQHSEQRQHEVVVIFFINFKQYFNTRNTQNKSCIRLENRVAFSFKALQVLDHTAPPTRRRTRGLQLNNGICTNAAGSPVWESHPASNRTAIYSAELPGIRVLRRRTRCVRLSGSL